MASAKEGHGPCPLRGCHGTATYSLSAGGKRKFACTHCDATGYADQGGHAFTRMGQAIQPAKPPADLTPPPPPTVAPAPAPRKTPGLLIGD